MTRTTQPVPACPLCGTPVYSSHTCKVSALAPRPAPRPDPTPPASPPRSACLHAVTCLDARAGRPCPLVAPKPANFDDLVREARASSRLDQGTLDVWGRAYREDVGL